MNHQDVRNQYLQVHGIDPADRDPVENEVDALFAQDDEPRCNAATHGRRCSTCTCEDSRDE